MMERESRMDRQRLCPEFNRIKDQQLSRRQTAERRASRCGPCNISNNHRYTNTRCEAAYRNVNIQCVRLFEPMGYDQDLFRWAKLNISSLEVSLCRTVCFQVIYCMQKDVWKPNSQVYGNIKKVITKTILGHNLVHKVKFAS